jgi:hypothetical protein
MYRLFLSLFSKEHSITAICIAFTLYLVLLQQGRGSEENRLSLSPDKVAGGKRWHSKEKNLKNSKVKKVT